MNKKRVATVATRLEEALKLTGKKQADLVRLTGLDKGSISHYIRGKYEPKSRAIRKLAIALNVSEMWLWGYDVPSERTAFQKKNEKLLAVITRMRTDDEFFDLVETLSQLELEQYDSIKQLIAAFTNKQSND